jgi:hypothetical protein
LEHRFPILIISLNQEVFYIDNKKDLFLLKHP